MCMTYCMGKECPVRNTCKRYTGFLYDNKESSGFPAMRKCTNQKKYIQDERSRT